MTPGAPPALGGERSAPAAPNSAVRDRRSPWPHRLACVLAACTLLLIGAGGLVTSTESGLAFPDWPLSDSSLLPPMEGAALYEHGHRMIATFVGLLTRVLACWLQRIEERRGVRVLGLAAVGMVAVQGVLGGLTVVYELPWQISTLHGVVAQLFLCVAVALALATSPWWRAAPRLEVGRGTIVLARVVVAAILVQLLLGALMRHLDAGLAIRDFPLAMGRLIPPLESTAVALHFAHRAWAVVVTILVAAASVVLLGRARGSRLVVAGARLLPFLVVVQIVLGALTVLAEKHPVPTTLHVASGALILAAAFAAMLGLERIRSR